MEIKKRENAVENALKWAKMNGYAYGDYALKEYCDNRNMEYSEDYRNIITLKEKTSLQSNNT